MGQSRQFVTYARADGARPDVLERGTLLDFRPSADRVWDTFLDTQVDPGGKLNEVNPKICGGGGNRKHPISCRIRQLRGIAGNRILGYRKQMTAKSTFGKTLCQLAKSNARVRREGRTWETCPPPRPWASPEQPIGKVARGPRLSLGRSDDSKAPTPNLSRRDAARRVSRADGNDAARASRGGVTRRSMGRSVLPADALQLLRHHLLQLRVLVFSERLVEGDLEGTVVLASHSLE